MLIDLVPEFLDILAAPDPVAAYGDYLDRHRAVLASYWHNYVLDLESPHVEGIIAHALAADRSDLTDLLARLDVRRLVDDALARADEVLEADRATDCYLMVGLGGANAGELVVRGRGSIFLCLEHFTGRANPTTFGLGLDPALLPLWAGHEAAHVVRYTSPASASELKRLVDDAGGSYDYWATGSRATLRELLVNEGLAVHAARAVAPGLDAASYFGYTRRQYHRLRELEAFLRHITGPDLEATALGLRLRYLSGGMSPAARHVGGKVIPERAGYYLGHRMTEALVEKAGLARAVRAAATDFQVADDAAGGVRTA